MKCPNCNGETVAFPMSMCLSINEAKKKVFCPNCRKGFAKDDPEKTEQKTKEK